MGTVRRFANPLLPLTETLERMYAFLLASRTMDSVSTALYTNPQCLSLLSNLRTMTIDFSAEGETTHHTSARLILSGITSNLTRLELLYLPSITPRLLFLIASHCPNLRALILRCSDRLLPDCCWNCYHDAGEDADHSPIPDAYCNAKHLAVNRAYTRLRVCVHILMLCRSTPSARNWCRCADSRTCTLASTSRRSTSSRTTSTMQATSAFHLPRTISRPLDLTTALTARAPRKTHAVRSCSALRHSLRICLRWRRSRGARSLRSLLEPETTLRTRRRQSRYIETSSWRWTPNAAYCSQDRAPDSILISERGTRYFLAKGLPH